MKEINYKLRCRVLATALCITILGISSYDLKSQSLDRQVIGSAGIDFSGVNGTLQSTLGESFIQNYSKFDLWWSEGFHQIDKEITTSINNNSFDHKTYNFHLITYPNPTTSTVEVLSSIKCRAKLYDLKGRVMAYTSNFDTVIHFNLTAFPSGIYFIKAFDDTHRAFAISKIIKL